MEEETKTADGGGGKQNGSGREFMRMIRFDFGTFHTHLQLTHSHLCVNRILFSAPALGFFAAAAVFCLGPSVLLFGCSFAADGRVLVILHESLIRWWMMHECVCVFRIHTHATISLTHERNWISI